MKISDFVCFEAIVPELESKDSKGVIAELVLSLEKANKLGNGKSADIIKAVMKREAEASTGLGRGVAVPHVKHSAIKDVVVAVGRSSIGIDFSSLDKQPVYSVILLLSPADNPDKHLQAMENIFKCLQDEDFRRFLRQSQTTEQIKELILETDEKLTL